MNEFDGIVRQGAPLHLVVLIGDERIRARASSLITFLMTIAIDIHILDDSPRYREYSKYYLENKFM
jgi:hypothetical protein